jgi:mRNA deadenylase 3'-5' endonuclease subunit Ccr4
MVLVALSTDCCAAAAVTAAAATAAAAGQEPDYTSSHSQFMGTCDYIWFTSTPLTRQQQQQPQRDACQAGASSSSSGSRYELRPVAVLQPPDGLRLNKGLPAKALGSDHICLLTDFELVLRQ